MYYGKLFPQHCHIYITILKGRMKLSLSSPISLVRLATLVVSFSALSFAQSLTPPYHINCGGTGFTDAAGTVWATDTGYFSGGVVFTSSNAISTPDVSLAPMYQTEMFNEPLGFPLTYTFAAPAATYTVRLHFSEIWEVTSAVGARVFDVIINKETRETGLDIFAVAGANTALVKDYSVTSTGTITISFLNTKWNAKINGIEIALEGTLGVKAAQKQNFKKLELATRNDAGTFSVVSPFSGKYSLTVRNIHGAVVAQKAGFAGNAQTIAGLRPGVYFVSAQSGAQLISTKVSLVK